MNVYANDPCRDVDAPRSIDVVTRILYQLEPDDTVPPHELFCSSKTLDTIRTSLLTDQVKAFDQLVDGIIKGVRLFTIDAGPGTGKSYLVNMFIKALAHEPRYLVYSHNLLQLVKPLDLKASTTCSFLCSQLGVSFLKVKHMFQGDLDKIIRNVQQCIDEYNIKEAVVILDEYSVVSPWFLVTLLVYCAKNNKVLLLVGDSFQQRSLSCHSALRDTNLALLSACSTVLTLEENVRQRTDPQLQAHIQELKTWVSPSSLTVAHGQRLAAMFQSQLDTPDDYTLPFLSQFHSRIKARTELLCANHSHIKSYHVVKKDGTHLPPSTKFVNYLPLILNQEYIYWHQSCKQRVRLTKITPTSVYVKTVDGCSLTLTKVLFNTTNTHALHLEYVNGCVQYPLSLPFFTFHSVQGLTIDYPLVDIDANTRSSNSLYVGFSRLQRTSQLHKVYLDLATWSTTKARVLTDHTVNEHVLVATARQLLTTESKVASVLVNDTSDRDATQSHHRQQRPCRGDAYEKGLRHVHASTRLEGSSNENSTSFHEQYQRQSTQEHTLCAQSTEP